MAAAAKRLNASDVQVLLAWVKSKGVAIVTWVSTCIPDTSTVINIIPCLEQALPRNTWRSTWLWLIYVGANKAHHEAPLIPMYCSGIDRRGNCRHRRSRCQGTSQHYLNHFLENEEELVPQQVHSWAGASVPVLCFLVRYVEVVKGALVCIGWICCL